MLAQSYTVRPVQPVQPVRVVIIHPRDIAAPTLGGIQTFLHDLVKHAPADFEITVAGVTDDLRRRPIGRRQLVEVEGGHAWTLPLAPAARLPRNPLDLSRMVIAQLRLRALMLDRRTIVQIHRPFRPFLLAGQRGPRVQFVHVDIRDVQGSTGWKRLARLYRPFSDGALDAMARIFVVNEAAVESLRATHPRIADRIEFLPGWFDEEVFHAPASASAREVFRAALAARLGLVGSAAGAAANDRLVLFAGRLDEVKDPDLALDAFAQVVGAGRGAQMVVAGEGDLRPHLERRAAELGLAERVYLLGDLPREELADVMRACDVLLLSSRAEGGGPRVVLEALACGLPVVGPVVGDIRRTVTSGANGWLATERTPRLLAEGLSWVFGQPREGLAQAATQAVAPYTARRVLEHLYVTYRWLAAGVETRS